MINLFDRNDQATWDLYFSLKAIGEEKPTIIIQDDGWLPDNLESPWNYFLREDCAGHPLFFNQIVVPDLWEIRGDNSSASIYDYDRRAGEIVYANPKNKRWVKEVKWFDYTGKVRSIDYYNCFGWRFAQETINLAGQSVIKTYYTQTGEEKIVENLITGDIILNANEKVLNFMSRTEFIYYYLCQRGFQLDCIRYNSLSYPFFISLKRQTVQKDLLFWQEPLGQTMPGNMKFIFNGQAKQTKRIIFFERDSYENAKKISGNKLDINFGGYIYQYKRKNSYGKNGLILTNLDQLEKIEVLIKRLPEMDFKIAAVTEMSDKLEQLRYYKNVTLYPNITQQQLNTLWYKCDFYLDINHQGELQNAIRTAFDYNLLVVGFENTAHNRHFTAKDKLFQPQDVSTMIEELKRCLKDPIYMQKQLEHQAETANQATLNQYRQLLE